MNRGDPCKCFPVTSPPPILLMSPGERSISGQDHAPTELPASNRTSSALCRRPHHSPFLLPLLGGSRESLPAQAPGTENPPGRKMIVLRKVAMAPILMGSAGREMGKRGEGLAAGRGLGQGGSEESPQSQASPGSGTKGPGSIQPLVSRKGADPWPAPSPHCLRGGAGRAGNRGMGGMGGNGGVGPPSLPPWLWEDSACHVLGLGVGRKQSRGTAKIR